MNLEEVKALVTQGETETIEFKRTTTQRKPAAKTICGMLNNESGGYVFFGVSDKSELKGQEVTSKTLEELSVEFRQIFPPVFPELGIKKSSAQITQGYRPQDIIGKQVLCVTNFPPKQIGPFVSEILVTGFVCDDEVVLCSPDKKIPDGTRLL